MLPFTRHHVRLPIHLMWYIALNRHRAVMKGRQRYLQVPAGNRLDNTSLGRAASPSYPAELAAPEGCTAVHVLVPHGTSLPRLCYPHQLPSPP